MIVIKQTLHNKILLPYHAIRVEALTKGGISVPSLVEVDLTDTGCSQSCIFCMYSSSRGNKIRQIDEGILLSFLMEAYEAGVLAFEFCGGGEPLNHSAFDSIVSGVRSFKGQEPACMGLATNGLRLDRVFDSIKNFSWVRISLDASEPITYSQLHGVGINEHHFEKVIQNIRTLVSKSQKTLVRLGYLVVPPYNHTKEQIFAACRLAQELKVYHIVFRPVSYPWQVAQEDWVEAHQAIQSAKAEFGAAFVLGGNDASWNHILKSVPPGAKPCVSRQMVLVIKADGTIPTCVLFRNRLDERPAIGNISQGFHNVWFSEAHQRSLNAYLTNSCPAICKHHRINAAIESNLPIKSGNHELYESAADAPDRYFI